MVRTVFFAGAVAVAGALAATSFPAQADTPGQHPLYRHALADLRRAHDDITAGGFTGDPQHPHDRACLKHIEDAIADINQAGIDDGKPMQAPIPGDPARHAGRLQRAQDDLNHALAAVSRRESNRTSAGGPNSPLNLQRRAQNDIQFAINELGLALQFDSPRR